MKQHTLAFYSTAAQVLPVLIVVAAIELRLLAPPRNGRFFLLRMYFTSAFCYAAVASETLALVSLREGGLGNGDSFSSTFVLITVIVGATLVFAAPLAEYSTALGRFLRDPQYRAGKATSKRGEDHSG